MQSDTSLRTFIASAVPASSSSNQYTLKIYFQSGVAGVTACMCRDPAGSVAVQLLSMDSIALPATCMASCAVKSLVVIGLSTGQLVRVSITSKNQAGPLQANVGRKTTDTTLEGNAMESQDSSNAALIFVTLSEQHAAAVTAASASLDGQNIASISATDGGVCIWDTFAGSAADLYVASTVTISGAACSAWLPDGSLLVGTNSNQLVVSLLLRQPFSTRAFPVLL